MNNKEFRQAKADLARKGMVLKVDDGEYNVDFIKPTGDSKYFTDNLEDAVATGHAMSETAFMNDEDRWPYWPRLSLKRGPNNSELGVLMHDEENGKWIVYLTTLYHQISDETKFIEYTSPAQVHADKWRID